MTSSKLIRSSVLAATAVVLVAALWLANGVADRMGGWVPHMASHLSAAVVGAALTAAAVVVRRLQVSRFQWWAGRVGALVFVAALSWFTASQLVESLSAVIEYPNAGVLHTASGLATMLGALVAMSVLVLTAFANIRGANASFRSPLALFSIVGATIVFAIMIVGFSPLAVVVTFFFGALLAVSVLIGRRREVVFESDALSAKREVARSSEKGSTRRFGE